MSRIAFSINEIGRVYSGQQTLFVRSPSRTFGKVQPGTRLWLAEPFYLERRFGHLSPTAARDIGAKPTFAADHLDNPEALEPSHGPRHPARSLCRDWHRAHLLVTTREDLRLQDLSPAQIANLGFSSPDAFAAHWNVEAQLGGLFRYQWHCNPQVAVFAFELVRQPIAFPPRQVPVKGSPRHRDATQPVIATPVASGGPQTPSIVENSRAFARHHAAVRQLSATTTKPVELAPRPVRSISAPGLRPRLPTLAERETGQCARCGTRLVFGCEHHPVTENREPAE